MKKPSTHTMVTGHPIFAVPMLLASVVLLFAGFKSGSSTAIIMAIGIIAALRNARDQISAYRAWKTEWDAMGDGPERRAVTPSRVIGIGLVAMLILLGFGMRIDLAYMAGFAVGWIWAQHWLVASIGLLMVAVLVQFVRRPPRRAKPSKPVIVIAKAILPVPTLADAYRALPPYCHALMRGQS